MEGFTSLGVRNLKLGSCVQCVQCVQCVSSRQLLKIKGATAYRRGVSRLEPRCWLIAWSVRAAYRKELQRLANQIIF